LLVRGLFDVVFVCGHVFLHYCVAHLDFLFGVLRHLMEAAGHLRLVRGKKKDVFFGCRVDDDETGGRLDQDIEDFHQLVLVGDAGQQSKLVAYRSNTRHQKGLFSGWLCSYLFLLFINLLVKIRQNVLHVPI